MGKYRNVGKPFKMAFSVALILRKGIHTTHKAISILTQISRLLN